MTMTAIGSRRSNRFQRFLLYLSITDPDFIKQCPRRELYLQEILGLAVLLTAILAGWSGAYAISTIYENVWVSILFGAIWALIIMNFDRQLVGTLFNASSTQVAEAQFLMKYIVPLVIRLPLAFLLGLIISVPLVLKIFEPEINAGLNEMEVGRVQQIITEGIAQKQSLRNQLELPMDQYKVRIAEINAELQKLREELGQEERNPIVKYIRKKNSGGNYFQIPINKESERLRLIRERIKTQDRELKSLTTESTQKKQEMENQLNIESNLIDRTIDAKKQNITPKSLLSRYKALNRLFNDDPATQKFNLVIQAVIILIEILPILMKVLSESGQYERIMEYNHKAKLKEMKGRING